METTNHASLMNFSERIQDEDLTIKFFLLTNNDGELSEEMKIAHETLLDKVPIKKNILLISEEECLAMNPNELNEQTVFIMEKFEGDAFHFIEDLKTIYILGVKTICKVLHDQCTIPAQYHIHNLSMKNFYICFASFEDKKKKAKLIKYVYYMGGYYSNSLKEITTHLVTNDIHSQKYYYANEHKMKIMKPEWIQDYWEMQQDINFNISPDDESFDNYKLPLFNGIVACSTGIDLPTKRHLMEVIESNGGEFSQTFKTATVNILFMTPKDLDSAKGKAAVKFKIKCAYTSWVFDSIKAGYALPLNDKYLISPSIKASTPTKETSGLGKFNFDNTMLSDITAVNSTAKHLTFEETQRSTRASVARTSSAGIQQSYSIQKKVTEKNVMINASTSNRRVRASSSNVKNDTFKKPPPIIPSKLSNTRNTLHEKENIQEQTLLDISATSEDKSYIQILTGQNVFIYGYTETEDMLQMIRECEKLGANVVDASYNKTVDYIITPFTILNLDEPKMKHKYILNDFWLEDCIENSQCINEIQFYHRPLFKSYRNQDILKGELFVLSNYDKDKVAPYVKMMVTLLGGQSKDELNKNRESILLSPIAQGKKYNGAISWDFTVLRGEWLYECIKNKMRCDETPFLVGESKLSKHNKKNQRASIIPFSQGTPTIESEPELMETEQNEYKDNEAVLPKRVAELRPRNIDSPKTPGTPSTPTTPNRSVDDGILSISDLVADMPTPQRELTKAAILEHQAKSQVSPRAARQKELLKTPGLTQKAVYDESSPMPELPDIMRPPPGPDFSIRPDSSPESQWFWKMKMEILDEQYMPRSESLKKALKEDQFVTPYAIKRYNFFKRTIPNYNSPYPGPNNGNDKDGDVSMEEASNRSNLDKSPTENQKTHDELLNLLKSNERSAISPIPRDKNCFKKQLDYDDDEFVPGNNRKTLVWATSTQMFVNGNRKSSKNFEMVVEESEALSIDENNYVHEDSSPIRILEEPESIASAAALDSEGNEIDFIGEQKDEQNNANWIFAVSSTHTNEDKAKLIESIQELGGNVDDNVFTYLIMPKLAKSSKYFCALARGNYILHPDFIKDSMSTGKFLDPEDYEYGNPKLKCNTSDLKVVKEVFRGPYICRQAVQMNPERYRNGLFAGMKFLIVASQDKRDIFSYVIATGGGVVIDERPEFKAAVLKRENIDYCLVDSPQALTVKDQKTLAACNITIRNVRFIYEYLLSENLLA